MTLQPPDRFSVSPTYLARREARERVEHIAATEVCALCGSFLTAANDPDANWPALRCGLHGYMADTVPMDTSSTLRRWRRGEKLNAIEQMRVANQLHRMIHRAEDRDEQPDPRWAEWLKELGETMADRQLAQYKPAAIITQEEAGRFIDMASLKMTPQQRAMAVQIMTATGLSPILGEVMIYEGRLYVTVDGFRKLLNASGTFDGMEAPHYLSATEKEAQGYAADDIVVRIALYRKGNRMPVYAIGKANAGKPFRGNQVEKTHPQVMAENRAFRRAARAGWQDILSGYGVTLDPTLEEDDALEGSARIVDVATGEIMDDTLPDSLTDYLPDGFPEPEQAEEEAPLFEHEEPAAVMTMDEIVNEVQKDALRKLMPRVGWRAADLVQYVQDTYGKTLDLLTGSEAAEVILYLSQKAQQTRGDVGRAL